MLTITGTKEMMYLVCDRIMEAKQRLTLLDGPIGDGDHGIGMSRGMSNAKKALMERDDFENVQDIFYSAGRAMISTMGGSSGVIFGTMFMGAAADIPKTSQLDGVTFVRMMRNALDQVKKKGKALPGDKTMVDAFEPAVVAMEAALADHEKLGELLPIAAGAAGQGACESKNMIARYGHSKTLGERALGHPDPGAVSVQIIFEAMEEYVNGTPDCKEESL